LVQKQPPPVGHALAVLPLQLPKEHAEKPDTVDVGQPPSGHGTLASETSMPASGPPLDIASASESPPPSATDSEQPASRASAGSTHAPSQSICPPSQPPSGPASSAGEVSANVASAGGGTMPGASVVASACPMWPVALASHRSEQVE
jgi:hypothetical protein